jgi:hypothetical protein
MVFGAQNLLLFPKREDVPLGNFTGFSGSLKLQLNTQESGAKAFDCQGIFQFFRFLLQNQIYWIMGYLKKRKKTGMDKWTML